MLRHARRKSRCQPVVLQAVKQPHPGALQAAAKAILMSLGILAGPASAQAMSQEAVDLFRLASVWQSVNNTLILGFLTFYAASAWNNHKLYKARQALTMAALRSVAARIPLLKSLLPQG